MSWIDDNLIVGPPEAVKETKDKLMKLFKCKDLGEAMEYVGCKLTRTEDGGLKFTQEVLLQRFRDEFHTDPDKKWTSPAQPGSILTKTDDNPKLTSAMQMYLRSGIGILMHIMQWSRPEMSHSTRDLAKHMNPKNLVLKVT